MDIKISRLRKDAGVAMVDYALIAGFIGFMVMFFLTSVGNCIHTMVGQVNEQLPIISENIPQGSIQP